MDEELEAVAYTKYEWDCPECGEVNATEFDPAGEVVECGDCGRSIRITETR
jgi:ribosomal protein S27E